MFFKRRPSPLFSLTPSRSPSPYSIAQCSTSSTSRLNYPHPASRVRVLVCWDLFNCAVPRAVNAYRVAQAIADAVKSSGITGPIDITAFGDRLQSNRWKLESTGINFIHAPRVGNSADNSLDMYLENWASQNPPPAHILLIGGSSTLLHNLRNKKYNILLACKEPAPAVLCRAATFMWNWDALVRGENLTLSYFNQPPDGSWYGNYEGPLEDPEIERPAFAPDDEVFQHEVFSQDSFWIDVQNLLNTGVGTFMIKKSRTREHLALYLQEYGPSVLKSVRKSDVLLMVDELITEKKWVQETPELINPFKLTSSARITLSRDDYWGVTTSGDPDDLWGVPTSSGDAQGSSGPYHVVADPHDS